MKYDRVITGGRIVTAEHEEFIGEIGIVGAKIAAVSEGLGKLEGCDSLRAEGRLVMPGFLDLHVHCNDPGVTYREDFLTATSAAAAGGVTLIADMPLANDPVTIDASSFNAKLLVAGEKCVVDFRIWGGLVDDNTGSLQGMHDLGAHGFKAFTCFAGEDFPRAGEPVLLQGLREANRLGSFVGIHCENEGLIQRSSETSDPSRSAITHFLECHRPEVEKTATETMLKYGLETGGHVHICHASLPEVVEMVSKAKKQGVRVTVETCPQYLIFTTEDLHRIGGSLKCTPPVRDRAAVDGLWAQIRDGLVDFIVSDHSPATREEKSPALPFSRVWGGINGIQFLFQALYTEGVSRDRIALRRLVELYSAAPAKFIGQYPQRGTLQAGSDATFVIYNPEVPNLVTEHSLLTKNKQSPYIGRTFDGRVEETWIRGKRVFRHTDDGPEITATPGSGMFVR